MTNELNMIYVDIDIFEEDDIIVSVEECFDLSISIEEGISGDILPYYEGSYNVTPRKREQVLHTKDKSMSQDVKVFAIPYNEVSNPFGGKTITIGIE